MRMTTSPRPQIVDIEPTATESEHALPDTEVGEIEKPDLTPQRQDAFGDEEFAEVKYKVLKWWYESRPFLPLNTLATFAIADIGNSTGKEAY